MTYTANITGHGASGDDAKEAFSNFVRALRQINAEGDSSLVIGQISGSDNEGNSFALTTGEVVDLDAEDTSSDEDQEQPAGEAPEDESETESGVDPDA